MGKIFRAQAVVTSNQSDEVFLDGFLAIDKNKIVDVGPWKKRPRSKSFSMVDARYGWITPGLFNLHVHLPMTLFRGIAEDLELQTWLFDYILPLERKWVDKNFVRVGAELGICESIRNGVTFLGEMYFYESVIADSMDRLGVRGIAGQNVWDMEAPDFKTKEQSFAAIRALAKKWKDHPRVMAGVAPHAPYTCSVQTMREAAALATELNIPAMIHLSESKREFDDAMKQHHKSPTELVADSGLLNVKNIILPHSVWMNEKDFGLLKRENVSVVLNPQCNAKLASGVAPVQSYKEKGVRFALGTDGPASNNNLDIFAEMNFLSKIHHLTQQNLTGLPGPKVFAAATRDAARAVGLHDRLGSLEPGKEADFIIIDARASHLTPLTRVYSHLIYSVGGSDVESVYIAGKAVMQKRKILTVDERAVRSRANKLWSKISKDLRSTQNGM